MARLPRGVDFSPDALISTAAKVGATGRISVKGQFRYNTKFPREWANDRVVRQRFEELRAIAQAGAERRVPVRTGNLRSSIKSRLVRQRDGTLRIELTAGGRGAYYWAFVEYGTGRRGSVSRQFEPGLPPGYVHGARAGQKAQPYLRPALLDVKRRIQRTGRRAA